MHIAIATGDSGIARNEKNIFWSFLQELSKYCSRISVIAPANGNGEVIKISEKIFVYPSKAGGFLRWDFWSHFHFVKKQILEINAEQKIDLISAHFIPPFFMQVIGVKNAAHILKTPFILELHGLTGLPVASNAYAFISREFSRLILSSLSKNQLAHLRIVNQNHLKLFADNCGWDEKRINFLPAIYLDKSIYKPASVTRNKNQFLFVGRFDPVKNIPAIIKGFAIFNQKNPESKLILVGDGEQKKLILALIRRMKLEDRVILKGWLSSSSELVSLYHQTSALILGSESEGGPRVVFEAMACKTAIIATKVGLLKDLSTHKKDIIFFDGSPEDLSQKLDFFVDNPESVQKIVESAYNLSAKFDFEKNIAICAAKYLELASKK